MSWRVRLPTRSSKVLALAHSDVRTTVKYLGNNDDKQADAMVRVAQYRKSLIVPQKVQSEISQRDEWAQGDLDS